jgi:hypothetical protein
MLNSDAFCYAALSCTSKVTKGEQKEQKKLVSVQSNKLDFNLKVSLAHHLFYSFLSSILNLVIFLVFSSLDIFCTLSVYCCLFIGGSYLLRPY